MKRKHRWIIAGLMAVALPFGSASAGNLDFMPKGDWAEKLASSELKEERGAGYGIAFDIAITGSVENVSDALASSSTTPPPGFGLSVNNGVASVTTTIGGINGNGIFIFNQIPGDMNVVNTTVVVNIAINNFTTP